MCVSRWRCGVESGKWKDESRVSRGVRPNFVGKPICNMYTPLCTMYEIHMCVCIFVWKRAHYGTLWLVCVRDPFVIWKKHTRSHRMHGRTDTSNAYTFVHTCCQCHLGTHTLEARTHVLCLTLPSSPCRQLYVDTKHRRWLPANGNRSKASVTHTNKHKVCASMSCVCMCVFETR